MQFSLLSFFEGSELGQLYSEVCILLRKIHANEREGRKLEAMADSWLELVVMFRIHCKLPLYSKENVIAVNFSTGKVFNMQKIHAFRMCIWLCVYNEFYQKEVRFNYLIKL